jgi:hypothetical protein
MFQAVLVAAIAAMTPTIAVTVGWFLTRAKFHASKEAVQQIHVLVNSRLDEALKRIDELEKRLGVPDRDKF